MKVSNYLILFEKWAHKGTPEITEKQLDKVTKYTFNLNLIELAKKFNLSIIRNIKGEVTNAGEIYNKLIDFSEDLLDYICYNNRIYKHGFGGIIDHQEKIKPTKWYNKQHPFEFEVIVREDPAAHKIFNNLRIISNKAKPESFHYEIIGLCYDFANDKENAYFRLEAKKNLYRNLGSDICYNSDYTELTSKYISNYENEKNSLQNKKSISFPLYYNREDRDEDIEDTYELLNDGKEKDYQYLSGTEILRFEKLDEYRIRLHDKAVDITESGRLRGNMHYLEDFWNILINPIIVIEKNEDSWKLPPMDVRNSRLPNDITTTDVNTGFIPSCYNNNKISIEDALDVTTWGKRREIKLKDKWIKVRIRYSGEELALISSLSTSYCVSYA